MSSIKNQKRGSPASRTRGFPRVPSVPHPAPRPGLASAAGGQRKGTPRRRTTRNGSSAKLSTVPPRSAAAGTRRRARRCVTRRAGHAGAGIALHYCARAGPASRPLPATRHQHSAACQSRWLGNAAPATPGYPSQPAPASIEPVFIFSNVCIERADGCATAVAAMQREPRGQNAPPGLSTPQAGALAGACMATAAPASMAMGLDARCM